jgi:4-hydroxy-2-oxoheptanedioate aldolase
LAIVGRLASSNGRSGFLRDFDPHAKAGSVVANPPGASTDGSRPGASIPNAPDRSGPFDQRESLGGWCAIPSAFTAEIVGRAGFDWVCVDTQHGPISVETMLSMLQALDAAAVPALVRVPRNEPSVIAHAMDCGAAGVIVPFVDTPEEAAAAAAAVRYAPAGARSFGPTRAALRDAAFTTSNANTSALCLVQIETPEAVAAVELIAATPGVDGLLVGPSDLTLTMGVDVGDVRHAQFRDACQRVVAACQAAGIIPAIFCGSWDAIAVAREDGFQMIAVLSDVRLLRGAAADALSRLRPAVGAGVAQ